MTADGRGVVAPCSNRFPGYRRFRLHPLGIDSTRRRSIRRLQRPIACSYPARGPSRSSSGLPEACRRLDTPRGSAHSALLRNRAYPLPVRRSRIARRCGDDWTTVVFRRRIAIFPSLRGPFLPADRNRCSDLRVRHGEASGRHCASGRYRTDCNIVPPGTRISQRVLRLLDCLPTCCDVSGVRRHQVGERFQDPCRAVSAVTVRRFRTGGTRTIRRCRLGPRSWSRLPTTDDSLSAEQFPDRRRRLLQRRQLVVHIGLECRAHGMAISPR